MSKAEGPQRRGGVPQTAPEPAGHEADATATATVSSWQRTAGVTLLLTAIVPVVLVAFAWPTGHPRRAARRRQVGAAGGRGGAERP